LLHRFIHAAATGEREREKMKGGRCAKLFPLIEEIKAKMNTAVSRYKHTTLTLFLKIYVLANSMP
jgi:hypothetical protein